VEAVLAEVEAVVRGEEDVGVGEPALATKLQEGGFEHLVHAFHDP
jgi:hypothetical protein